MNNLIITWLSGDTSNLPETMVFFKSLEDVGFQGDKVILTNDLPFNESYLMSLDWQIVKLDFKNTDYYDLLRNRWHAFYKYLIQSEKSYKRVVISDSRDVLFQDLSFLKHPGVNLVCEGFLHQDSSWNYNDQMDLQFHLKTRIPCLNWPVLNGGFQVGDHLDMINFCKNFSIACAFAPAGTYTDQAILNYMYNTICVDDRDIHFPQESNLCLTGEGVKNGIVGLSYSSYSVFHQWDRTVYKDIILDKYK